MQRWCQPSPLPRLHCNPLESRWVSFTAVSGRPPVPTFLSDLALQPTNSSDSTPRVLGSAPGRVPREPTPRDLHLPIGRSTLLPLIIILPPKSLSPPPPHI